MTHNIHVIVYYRLGELVMFERIIVPLDGSRLSAQAIPYASEIAKRFKAEIVLLRVVSNNNVTYLSSSRGIDNTAALEIIPQQMLVKDVENTAHARRYLMNRAKGLADDGFQVTYQVIEGAPARSIMDFAISSEASLIVMMSHGRGRFKRAILGSVTDAIMRGSIVPVLVIRAKGMPD
jgi:nucleotide-binding universal stress UspA family protein